MVYEKINAENRQFDADGYAVKYMGFMQASDCAWKNSNEFNDLHVGA